MLRTIPLRLALALFALVASPALAEEPAAPSHDPRAAFAETDKNKDGKVDREEFQMRVMETFFHGDHDKDGYMTESELLAVVLVPTDFAAADRNHDSRVSYPEFVDIRFEAFEEVDTDHDSLLTVEEVVTAYEGKS